MLRIIKVCYVESKIQFLKRTLKYVWRNQLLQNDIFIKNLSRLFEIYVLTIMPKQQAIVTKQRGLHTGYEDLNYGNYW